MENVKVILWGLGAMGGGIGKMLAKKKGVDIVGAIDIGAKLGKSLYEVVPGIERGDREDVIVGTADEVIKPGAADIVVVCTDSFTAKVYDKLVKVMENGMNVITSAEEMSYPQAQEPELAKKLDEIAKANGVTVLGTGINPGLIMDLLVLVWTGACESVDHIVSRRVNSLSPFGPAVMEEQGIGITVEEFNARKADGTMAGHVGFAESVMMITDALGWKLDKFEQDMEPIVTDVDRKSPYGFAAAGQVAGVAMKGWGYVDGEMKIEMDHPQQIEPEQVGVHTGDYVFIKGTPDVNMSNTPEIEGGIGTMAMILNSIPHVINARPGLKTMIDIPVVRAIMGDMRDMIEPECKIVK
ncbi:MAG: dihydrodipicolinate reductase [Firmicutes bacterium]|nr:dihydrodipicolinate reductase [Bacillota bacterium]